MPYATFKSLEDQVSQIKGIIELNENLRQQLAMTPGRVGPVIDDLYWRRYDYCSAILRLYASFERFVIDALQKWLDWVVENNFPLLYQSDKVISRYRFGVGEILKRSTEARFSKINITALVDGLASLQNKECASLGIDAVFASAPNLRLKDIVSALESLELIGSEGWINAFPPLKEHCESFDTSVESFLKDLIERRNEAAHGNQLPDDFWSVAIMKSAIDFVLSLALAISEFIISKMLIILEKADAFVGSDLNRACVGSIASVIRRHNALIIRSNNVGVWEGMPLLIATTNRCYMDCVNTIQLNGHYAKAWLPSVEEEIGVSVNILPPASARIYSLREISWL